MATVIKLYAIPGKKSTKILFLFFIDLNYSVFMRIKWVSAIGCFDMVI